MCMNSEIGPDNPLYPFICNLPGLNRRIGKNNLTSDPDWKHMDKRWFTLLCSSEGLAVKNLLLSIVEIGKLDPEEFDPSEAVEFEALCLLGELFDAMLQPFTNTELSLSEQIESLIKFSHLLGYSAMVKNTVLLVPKTRILNGSLKVFICLLGDDVLEALFGRSRMIGCHSPNCNLIELRDRFTSAMTLDPIFEEHSELERKPAT
ncbi:hypothetical protein B0H10DRAFT_1944790 [Mycena sp. CBHHK59/15]|nr:hypothetical protein B0H10DRAFT_1944790 [Mycena sp. CBHHK59/15]